MAHPKVKISNDSGDTVNVTSGGKLEVELGTSPTIDIGDVSLLLDGTAAHYGAGDVADGGRTLRVTLADDDPAVELLTTIDSDTNGLLIINAGILNTLTTIDTDTGAMATLLGTIDTDTGAILSLNSTMSSTLTTIAGDTTDIESYFKAPTNSYSAGGAPQGLISLGFREDTLGASFSGLGITDQDWTYLQVNSKGGLYVTGSEVENAAVQSEPLLIGGRFDSSARTLGNGDAGAVALNASGHVIVDGAAASS